VAQGHRFAELLSKVAREITLRQASDVCCGDLTLEQFQTLRAVAGSEKHSIGSLSALLRVDLSTMSRNATLLERNGYLARSRSADDGRIVHVGITAKGRRALETLRCDERDLLQDVFDRLPAGDRTNVVEALEILQSCLEDSPAASAACCVPTPIRKGA
jgi:DNA-binding MarR family transcriptional regulator